MREVWIVNMPYEVIRVRRLVGEIIKRELPQANLNIILNVYEENDRVMVALNSEGNAKLAREGLENPHGYTVETVESSETSFRLHVSR